MTLAMVTVTFVCLIVAAFGIYSIKRPAVADSGAVGALLITGAVLAWVCAAAYVLLAAPAHARDLDGRYAQSPLKPWFDSLRSKNGPCCSDADGSAVSDVDWETKDGRYRVRLNGAWIDVPDSALITEPNRAGRAMVWPVTIDGEVSIRCFMPGSMT